MTEALEEKEYALMKLYDQTGKHFNEDYREEMLRTKLTRVYKSKHGRFRIIQIVWWHFGDFKKNDHNLDFDCIAFDEKMLDFTATKTQEAESV